MASTMGSVITSSNFGDKMPKFDPQANSSSLFALVDMGSNGIRFSISDLSPPNSRLLPCILKERADISLYDALHETGGVPFQFSTATISRVANTLAGFKSKCDQYRVPLHQVQVFATEAMRTAENRDDMLSAIYRKSGLKVDILAPEAESLFGSLGARSGFDNVRGLFMDLGGGSVQMTYLDSEVEGYEVLAAQAAKSMPYGAARLSQALGSKEASQTVADLEAAMRHTFDGMQQRFPALKAQTTSKDGITIYLCGGGFRGYGSMLMHMHKVHPYPIPSIGGFNVTGKQFVQYDVMSKENVREQSKIPGLSRRRRQQFNAIVSVVAALVKSIPRINRVIFCAGGNREGVLYMKLPLETRRLDPLALFPSSDLFSPSPGPSSFDSATETLISLLPPSVPPQHADLLSLFSPSVLRYLIRETWANQGNSDDSNAVLTLHAPISGPISTLPGLTHEVRAIISLTLCYRWDRVLGPMDRVLHNSLVSLLGEEMTWWCQYLGCCLRFMAAMSPVAESQINVRCQTQWRDDMGKRAGKSGIRVLVGSTAGSSDHASTTRAVEIAELSEALKDFQGVGRGLDKLKLKIETIPWDG